MRLSTGKGLAVGRSFFLHHKKNYSLNLTIIKLHIKPIKMTKDK